MGKHYELDDFQIRSVTEEDYMALVEHLSAHGYMDEALSVVLAYHLAACRTFPLAGRIAHRSWNLTV